MYLRRNKSRGKIYYQIFSNDKKFIAQLGSIEQLLIIFSFWKKYKETIGELIQLGVVDRSSGKTNPLLTEKLRD